MKSPRQKLITKLPHPQVLFTFKFTLTLRGEGVRARDIKISICMINISVIYSCQDVVNTNNINLTVQVHF